MHDEPWEAVDWSAIPGPPAYRPETVLAALRAMLSPKATDWADPATMMRFAAGNDHGGTIYPAGVAATAAMLEVIDMHPGDARRAALAVLLDWWVFDPEPGYEEFLGENKKPVNLVLAIQDFCCAGGSRSCLGLPASNWRGVIPASRSRAALSGQLSPGYVPWFGYWRR